MKKATFIVLGIFVTLALMIFARNAIAETAIENGVRFVTGLKLDMGGLDIGIVKPFVRIDDLRLFNPPGYQEKVMIDIPEVFVDYDPPLLLKGKIHLREIRFHLKEFTVVKNERGALNLDSLKVVQEEKKEAQAPKEEAPPPSIQIDILELRIEKVAYQDHSSLGGVLTKEFNVNINERYEDVTHPETIVRLIVVKALMNTTIADLTNFDLGGLKGPIADTLATSTKLASQTAAKAQETLTQAAQEAPEFAKTGAATLKKKASALKAKLQENLF